MPPGRRIDQVGKRKASAFSSSTNFAVRTKAF
jgi:hypothetical protein